MSSSHSDNAIYPDKLEAPSLSAPRPSTSEDTTTASTTTLEGHEQDINPTKKGTGLSSQGTAGRGSEESTGDKIKSKLGM